MTSRKERKKEKIKKDREDQDIFTINVPICLVQGKDTTGTIRTKNGKIYFLKFLRQYSDTVLMEKSAFTKKFPCQASKLHFAIDKGWTTVIKCLLHLMLINRLTYEEELIPPEISKIIKVFLQPQPEVIQCETLSYELLYTQHPPVFH